MVFNVSIYLVQGAGAFAILCRFHSVKVTANVRLSLQDYTPARYRRALRFGKYMTM
jgi:hypothetical protein